MYGRLIAFMFWIIAGFIALALSITGMQSIAQLSENVTYGYLALAYAGYFLIADISYMAGRAWLRGALALTR